MIHAIGIELGSALSAKGCPIPVVDGPEDTETTTWARERIVIEYDPDGGDAFVHPLSQRDTPKQTFRRVQACQITIYARSPRAGAIRWEHRRRASHALDLVLTELQKIAKQRRNNFVPVSGGFFVPADLEGSKVQAGAAYRLSFSWDRSVIEQNWAGDVEATGTLAGISSTTKVSRANTRDNDNDPSTPPPGAETACGA